MGKGRAAYLLVWRRRAGESVVLGGGRRWVRSRLDCSIGAMKTRWRAVAELKMHMELRIAMLARFCEVA